jgi:hypothetical protein
MAGRGPAPKDPAQRRNAHAPKRGDWVDLPAENRAKPPALPRPSPKGGWSARSRRAWAAWWADPVSLLWGPADVHAVEEVLYLQEEFVGRSTASLANAVRLRLETLGLTEKGKRDNRWRIATDELAAARSEPETPSAQRRTALKVV